MGKDEAERGIGEGSTELVLAKFEGAFGQAALEDVAKDEDAADGGAAPANGCTAIVDGKFAAVPGEKEGMVLKGHGVSLGEGTEGGVRGGEAGRLVDDNEDFFEGFVAGLVLRPAGKFLSDGVHEDDFAIKVGGNDAIADAGEGSLEGVLNLFGMMEGEASFEVVDDDSGEVGEGIDLVEGKAGGTGDVVDDAEGADGKAAVGDEGGAGVEADSINGSDEGVVEETGVLGSVGHDHDGAGLDGEGAKGAGARSLGGVDAVAAFEPLVVGGNEAKECDGALEQAGGEGSGAIEGRFGGGGEDIVAVEFSEAGGFVEFAKRWGHSLATFNAFGLLTHSIYREWLLMEQSSVSCSNRRPNKT